jgi:uncharacterized protein (TIGR00730 family)
VSETSICVYCASSQRCDQAYRDAARTLGAVLAGRGYSIIYGGGAVGLMGALADGAVAAGGKVVGIMPKFMLELEWAHRNLTELRVVEDMRARKHAMLSASDGLVTLPGGSGTLEELFEAITLKRLGFYTHPIVLVNTRDYFRRLVELLEHAISERFMGELHRAMWQVVATPEEVPAALDSAPPWSAAAREFAAVR